MSKLIQKEMQKLAQGDVAQKRKSRDVKPRHSAFSACAPNTELSVNTGGRRHGPKSSPSTHGLVPKLLR